MLEKSSSGEGFITMAEAAIYAHVSTVAIYHAIKKGRLKAEKISVPHSRTGKQWMTTTKDVDAYRADKYNPLHRMKDGEKLFDFDKGFFSPMHVAKILSKMLGRPFPTARIYYLLKFGVLKAQKHGGSWVIARDDAIALYGRESSLRQLTFDEAL